MKDLTRSLLLFFCLCLAVSLLLVCGTGCGEEATISIIQTEPYDLVDSSGHIDYYASGLSYEKTVKTCIKTWEKYKKGIFQEASKRSGADLVIIEVYGPNVNWDGMTSLTNKTVYLNVAYYNTSYYQNTKKYIQHSITHELGHTLGLNENNNGLTDDVMRQGILENVKLTKDDKASFDKAAERY